MEQAEQNSSGYYIVRTAPGKESKFLDTVEQFLAKKEGHGILAIFSPETVKGYVFAEAVSATKLVDLLRSVPNFKGVIQKPINPEEIVKYFEKEGEKVVVTERDIVEIIAGPFKGDRARVIRIIPGKEEVVIEPLNAPVPIPITLSVDDLRVIKADNQNE